MKNVNLEKHLEVGSKVIRQRVSRYGSNRSYELVEVTSIRDGQYGKTFFVNKERSGYNWTGYPVGKASGTLMLPQNEDESVITTNLEAWVDAANAVEKERQDAERAEKEAKREKAEAEKQARVDDMMAKMAPDLAAMRTVPTGNGILYVVDTVAKKHDDMKAVSLTVIESKRETDPWDKKVRVDWELVAYYDNGYGSKRVTSSTINAEANDKVEDVVAYWMSERFW